MLREFIMEPGQKMKDLRERYNLTRAQVTAGEINESNITNIEKGRQPLSENVAKIFCKNFKRITGENISWKWLMESVEEQVKTKLNKAMDSISCEKDESIYLAKDIEDLLNNYKIEYELKIKAFKILIKYHTDIKEYNKSLKLCVTASEIAEKEKHYPNQYAFEIKWITIQMEKKEDYDKAFSKLEYLEMLENMPKQLKKYINFNKGFIYKKKRMYIECLKELGKVETTDMHMILRKDVIRGNCHMELKNYSKAIEITEEYYRKAKEIGDIATVCLAYENLCEIYYRMGDIEKVNEYKEKRLNITNNYHIAEHLYFFAKISKDKEEKYNLLCQASEKAIELNSEDKKFISDIHNNIIKLLIDMKQYDKLTNWIDRCCQNRIDISKIGKLVFEFLLDVEEDRGKIKEITNKI